MALTINTNLSSLIVQKNLSSATTSLNNAIERMTTGYKINHAKDNAAGFSIAESWKTKIGSLDIASENASMGADLLKTTEENYSLITEHLQRVRDLTEQAANGTYGSDSLKAIASEMTARLNEIDRIAANAEFNGISLMKGKGSEINLQIGIDATTNSRISLEAGLFEGATSKDLLKVEIADFVKSAASTAKASGQLTVLDAAISNISTRQTAIGAAQNRVESAISSITVQSENLTSSLSTIRDADVANESSSYIKAQILQQASATLLATANQAPSIALNLI
ncbi:flagellin FliC [bacterium]|nr:flagellin FliC [bacterium]